MCVGVYWCVSACVEVRWCVCVCVCFLEFIGVLVHVCFILLVCECKCVGVGWCVSACVLEFVSVSRFVLEYVGV